jgi:hypothetical protein
MVDRIRPIEEPTVIEPSRVRGRPFQKGNPGRPPGSKNKLTRLLEELVERDGENLTRKAIQLGLKGNVPCLQYLWTELCQSVAVDRLIFSCRRSTGCATLPQQWQP